MFVLKVSGTQNILFIVKNKTVCYTFKNTQKIYIHSTFIQIMPIMFLFLKRNRKIYKLQL